jgi:hypothetical protein
MGRAPIRPPQPVKYKHCDKPADVLRDDRLEVDPVKRFAYDRFGTDMLGWGEQKTMRDFLMTSLVKSIVPQYIGGLVTMVSNAANV